jgi:hypothetical protein
LRKRLNAKGLELTGGKLCYSKELRMKVCS